MLIQSKLLYIAFDMYFILNFGSQITWFEVSFQILSFILIFECPGFQMKFKSNFFCVSKQVIWSNSGIQMKSKFSNWPLHIWPFCPHVDLLSFHENCNNTCSTKENQFRINLNYLANMPLMHSISWCIWYRW